MDTIETIIILKTYILVTLIGIYILAIGGALEHDINNFLVYMKLIVTLCYIELGYILIKFLLIIFDIFKERKNAKNYKD